MSAPAPDMTVLIGPWKTVHSDSVSTRRMRLLAHMDVGTDFYMAIQLEERTLYPADDDGYTAGSSYKSRILVGSLVDSSVQRSIFASAPGTYNLWCSNCWIPAPAGEAGGVYVPRYMCGRYFGRISHLPPCSCCSRPYLLFGEDLGRRNTHATVFNALFTNDLTRSIEAALLPHGIIVGTFTRDPSLVMSSQQKQEIEMMALESSAHRIENAWKTSHAFKGSPPQSPQPQPHTIQ